MIEINKWDIITKWTLLHDISSSDYLDRFKKVIEILLDDKTFLENDLRYMSMLSSNKFVSVVSYEKEIFDIKYISTSLLSIISDNWLISDIYSDNLLNFLYYAINNPCKEIFTNINILNNSKYLNIIFNNDNNDFELYFIDQSEHDSFIMSSLVRDMNMINHILWIKDSETLKHTIRVWEMSHYLSTLLWMDNSFLDKIKIAAMLHDIWKMKVPDHLLLKEWKINLEEYEQVKLHTTYWWEIMDKLSFIFSDLELLNFIKNITNYHHEKYDGNWYPFWLVWENIPIEARIVAVIDVFDALKSKRPYKLPFDDDYVKKIMIDWRASHFDPEILDLFLNHYYEFTWIRWINED